MSEYLGEIIYLTQSQYNTLKANGTVGPYTGLNNSNLYVTDSALGSDSDITSIRTQLGLNILNPTQHKFLKDTGLWTQVDWGDLTNVPSFGSAALVNVEDIQGSVVAWNSYYKKLTQSQNGGTAADLLVFSAGDNISLTVNENNTSQLQIAASNDKVTQSAVSDGHEYCVLLKHTNNTSNTQPETDGVNYCGTSATAVTVNPNTGRITAPGGLAGIADQAAADGNNNNIVNTYLTKAAGVTGIGWNNNTRSITQTIDGSTTDAVSLTTMGLANALHFLGIIDADTDIPASTDSNQNVTIGGNSITPSDGDVVMEYGELREYVFANGKWHLLGFTTSSIYEYTTTGNTWISDIKQYTDGRIEVVGTTTLDTSGKWTGTIATGKDETNSLYLIGLKSSALGAIKYTTKIKLQNDTIITGKWGATEIDVAHGGTGTNNFTANSVIMSGATSTSAFTTRAITDNINTGDPTGIITANTLINYSGTSNITTVGTIITGTWNGTAISTAYGGTGNSNYTASRMIYSETASKLSAASTIYSNGTSLGIGIPTAFSTMPNSSTFYVNGTSTMQTILPDGNTTFTYNLGSDSHSWNTVYTRTTSARYIDASNEETDDKLYIGYGYVVPTSSTTIYCSTSNSRTAILTADSSGVAISNHLEINGSNSSYQLYVNGSTNITGATSLGNNLSFTAAAGADVNNKIIWSEGSNGNQAILSYKVVTASSVTTSQLCFNTVSTANKKTLISFANTGTINAYIDAATPSFYPATNNSGSLGLTDHRWNKLYIGTANSYGGAGVPIYWNSGAPTATYSTQILQNWSLADASITYANTDYIQSDTQVITLVVTSGPEYLEGPLSWEIDPDHHQLTIRSTRAVSGTVTGYAILSRNDTISNTPAS